MASIDESEKEKETGNEANKDIKDEYKSIEDLGAVTTKNNGDNIFTLTIIGQVEGHQNLSPNDKATKYEHIIPTLVKIEEDDKIDGLLIILNTQGGDVEAGLAIAELIASMKKPTVSLVLGGSHSIGIPIAVSAKKSFVVRSGAMTMHPVRMNGLVLGVPEAFYYFKKIENRIVEFIARNSNMKKARAIELMHSKEEMAGDNGTILNGKDAVKEGLIDNMGGLSDALSYLHHEIRRNKRINKK